MAIVDRHGLLSVSTHAANHHEVRLVQLCFDFYMIEAKPENLIGDRAYDSDPLDEELRNDGIEMIAPHRSNHSKPPTQDRRRLSRCEYHAQNSAVLSSLPASLSSSDDFEIGSSHCSYSWACRRRGNLPAEARRNQLLRCLLGTMPRDPRLPGQPGRRLYDRPAARCRGGTPSCP